MVHKLWYHDFIAPGKASCIKCMMCMFWNTIHTLRCWRLYTESAYVSEMLTMTIPEIQRQGLNTLSNCQSIRWLCHIIGWREHEKMIAERGIWQVLFAAFMSENACLHWWSWAVIRKDTEDAKDKFYQSCECGAPPPSFAWGTNLANVVLLLKSMGVAWLYLWSPAARRALRISQASPMFMMILSQTIRNKSKPVHFFNLWYPPMTIVFWRSRHQMMRFFMFWLCWDQRFALLWLHGSTATGAVSDPLSRHCLAAITVTRILSQWRQVKRVVL